MSFFKWVPKKFERLSSLSAGAINDCIIITSNAKNDLLIWGGFLLDTECENSIPSGPTEPTIVH